MSGVIAMTAMFFFVLVAAFLFGTCIAFQTLGNFALVVVGAFLLVFGAAVLANFAIVFLGIVTATSYVLVAPIKE